MSKVKEIIELCPNYYNIVNAKIKEDDKLTEKIIMTYEKFVFQVDLNQKGEIEKVKKIDMIMKEYLEDNRLMKEIKDGLMNLKVTKTINNIVDFIVTVIISIYDGYLVNCTRKIYIPRWI